MINSKNIYLQLQGISDLLNPEELAKEEESSIEEDEEPGTSEAFDTEMFRPRKNTREKYTQTSKKRGRRTVKTQTIMKATSTFFQPKSMVPVPMQPLEDEVTDIGIAILNTQEKPHNIEQETLEQEATIEVEVECSSSEESVAADTCIEFTAVEASLTESEVEESSDDQHPDKRVFLAAGKSPQEQIKCIIFEEAILELFGKCGQCGSECIVTMENQIGSSCKICVSCTMESVHYFEWTTGPSMFKMPAFHLLVASAIIATGTESSKVLRLFYALNIPNVKRRELSDIQKNYGILERLYELCRVGVQEAFGQGARVLASHPIHASTILKDEVRLWLKAIHRRLARKAGYRNAYRGQISRDMPREIFAIFAKVVQNSDGFGVPFCCHSDNKSTEVVRLTSIRLLKELFVLLSGLPAEEVIFYFKRILASGSRKGHKVWLIVSEENDFIFTYNKNQGKLLISFYFGEWNVNGFAQHS